MTPAEYNEEIFRLWDESAKDELIQRIPIQYDPHTLKPSLPLFLGCNPSFSELHCKKSAKKMGIRNFDPTTFFNWENKQNLSYPTLFMLEAQALKEGDYFKKVKALTKEFGLPDDQFSHLDVFAIRHKNQQNIYEFIEVKMTSDDEIIMNSFGERNFELFEALFEWTNPPFVAVINGFISDLLKRRWKSKIVWKEQFGFHLITHNNREIPILFSSMLSGQRALDKSNFEYFKWRIRQARRVIEMREQSES